MAAFEYQALDDNGRKKKGVLEGDSPRQVRQQLREKGWVPVVVVQASGTRSGKEKKSAIRGFARNMSAAELALVTRQLATLVQSGLPLEEGLQAIARQAEKPRVKSIMLAVRSKVLEGHSLARALETFPGSFPELYRATVDAGERSGHLDLVLEQLADYTEARHDTNRAVKQAMIYPTVLFLFSVVIVGVLLTVAVPKIAAVFSNTGQALPTLTQWLINTGEFLQAWWWLLLLLVVLLIVAGVRLLQNPQLRFRFHQGVLTMPLVGRFIRTADSARLTSTLSILASSGVPLVEALKIAGKVTANLCIRDAVAQAVIKVQEGGSLHRALEACGYFSPMMIQMIASGETSGDLDKMLARTAVTQDKDLQAMVGAFTSLFGPVTLILMAMVIFTIVLAMMLPIISMNALI